MNFWNYIQWRKSYLATKKFSYISNIENDCNNHSNIYITHLYSLFNVEHCKLGRRPNFLFISAIWQVNSEYDFMNW